MNDSDFETLIQEIDDDYKEINLNVDEESDTEGDDAESEKYSHSRKLIDKMNDFATVEDYHAFVEEKHDILFKLMADNNGNIKQFLEKRKAELKPFRHRGETNESSLLVQKRFQILEEKELWMNMSEMRIKPLRDSAYILGGLKGMLDLQTEMTEIERERNEVKLQRENMLLGINQNKEGDQVLSTAIANAAYYPRSDFGKIVNCVLPQPKDPLLVDDTNRPRKTREMTPTAEKASSYKKELVKERAIHEAKLSLFFQLPLLGLEQGDLLTNHSKAYS